VRKKFEIKKGRRSSFLRSRERGGGGGGETGKKNAVNPAKDEGEGPGPERGEGGGKGKERPYHLLAEGKGKGGRNFAPHHGGRKKKNLRPTARKQKRGGSTSNPTKEMRREPMGKKKRASTATRKIRVQREERKMPNRYP